MMKTRIRIPLPTLASLALAGGLVAVPYAAFAGNYDLTVAKAKVEIDGRTVEKLTVNGSVPGPTLRLREGEKATITVANEADEPTSMHWHGILLPGIMDGAPGFNGFMGIAPGASYTYTFDIRQSGTYWYHSHTGTQDQSVLGAIVIEPAAPPPFPAERDYVVLLGDITPENSDHVLRNLKADPGYYNYNKRTLRDFFGDAREQGFGAALRDRLDWGEMRMDPTDLADVTGYAFLVNGKQPAENETFIFRKGERTRLRLINGSAMTLFDVRIPGLKMKVVAADGNDVEPVSVDEIRMGVAERYDVIVEPDGEGPYTIFAESIDRAGYARATLAANEGAEGPIPERRPRALLAMDDMGAAHGGHAGYDMDGAKDEHGGARDDHGGHEGHGHEGHGDVHQMDDRHDGHDGHDGHHMHEMQHDGAAHESPSAPARAVGWASGFPEGSKVLAYEDLRARAAPGDNRPPDRSIEMRLTGNMERYVWTLNDKRFGEAAPIRVRYGERVRIDFVNETMMAHPMHLHGMFFELENGAGAHRPLKDTVIVPPGKSVSVILTAREVGAWPLHCHLLYHMASGMMTAFVVEPPDAAEAGITPDGASLPLAISHDGHGGHAGHGGM
ncbi:copper resistance system multicopper oxidase [Parvibaculum sp.]|uniref:copper resistance system multicopper oxidase n=1 Tax=Parvibaculum sp. TaxID=2024848 RepID=UPI001E12F2EB|nr:copper resistance system multicopper oxidase [Parvibaculum sp.]MBX3490389.1 copper resistance system multicopper oxidase [Parvibaculum sp.]MCW5728246.1 copper resistance system multicopper oxidase [Parvibaculum sp.]